MKDFFFPDPPRDFPLRRAVRISLRALHVLSAGLLAGAFWFGADPAALRASCAWTAISGIALLLTDLFASFSVLIEVRGLVVVGKIAALLLAFQCPRAAPMLLAATMIIGVLSSHMPARFRHRLWLPIEGIRPDERKG